MKRIRAGSGLGDSLYLRPVVDYFVRKGETVVALSDYSGIFLGSGATVEPFRRTAFDVVAHYVGGKRNPATTQWQDVCSSAGIPEIPLSMPWSVRNAVLTSDIRRRAAGRRIILVHGGREPMARQDAFARELLPRREPFDAALGALSDCFLVGIGGKDDVHYVPRVDYDMRGLTTVAELLDLAYICNGIVAQCSFAVPLAELFDKPLLVVWAARGLASSNPYIKSITPQKILSKPTSWFAMDDSECIAEEARDIFAGVLA